MSKKDAKEKGITIAEARAQKVHIAAQKVIKETPVIKAFYAKDIHTDQLVIKLEHLWIGMFQWRYAFIVEYSYPGHSFRKVRYSTYIPFFQFEEQVKDMSDVTKVTIIATRFVKENIEETLETCLVLK